MKFSLAGDHGKSYVIRIIEATGNDADIVRTIIEIDLMTFSQPTWSQTTVEILLRHGRTFMLMADEMVIGSCHCMRSWERPHEAALFAMAIRPGWRGKGLGTRFLQGVMDSLERDGIRSVVLEVDSNNRAALRVYESRLDFRVVSTLDDQRQRGQRRLMLRKMLRGQDLAEVTELHSASDELSAEAALEHESNAETG